MFAEIYCEGPGHSVEIFYANTPEGEAKVEIINKQVAGYLWNVLTKHGASEEFILCLLINTIDMTLVHEAPKCKYDFETGILTTPGKAEEKQVSKLMKQMSFYQDFVGKAQSLGKVSKSKINTPIPP